MASVKEKLELKKAELLSLTMKFSKNYLNEEYDDVITKLINKMARKREVPFLSGRIEIWAAAVIHALGTINFLFDKDSQPYVSASDIYEYFGTKQSTTSQRSKQIRDMFKMGYFNNEFSVDSISQQNPFNNLALSDGLIVPQGKVEEKLVDLEEWEIQVAQILGITSLKRGKKYKERALFQMLDVTEEKLLRFYDFLSNHLTFPLHGIYEEEIVPSQIVEFEVECLRLNKEVKVDEFAGILAECRVDDEMVLMPLVIIQIDEEHVNSEWMELYQAWFCTYS